MARIIEEALSVESAGSEPSTTEQDMLANAHALEQAAGDIQDAAHEMEIREYAAEDLDHAADTVERIVSSIEARKQEDERGLTRADAEAYQLAFYAAVGEGLSNPVSSLEAFGSDSERARATDISLEESKGKLKQLWDAIIDAIKKGVEAFMDFITKFFDSLDKMQKRAQDLQKQAKQASDADPGEIKIPKAKQVAFGGSVDPDSVQSGYQAVSNELLSVNEQLVSNAEAYYKVLGDQFKDAGNKSPDEVASELQETLDKAWQEMTKAVGEDGGDSVTLELPGGKQLTVEREEVELGESKIKRMKPPKISSAKGSDPSESASPMGKGDLAGFLNGIASKIEQIQSQEKTQKQLAETRKNLQKQGQEVIKASEDGKLGEAWDSAKLRVWLRFANMSYDSAAGKIDNYVFTYFRALLAYAEGCVEAYNEASSSNESHDSEDSTSTECLGSLWSKKPR